eukprot:CAMPEP_0181507738 /NCGR_PEP_ID=MMETSP1110-20121109/59334_1 /TAXON_ID=174948 /ORGANISM="Symbiodinium sp., Strain CCMP421" /LENGTH=42 /DNA_ID= /DNA_START= /DNA_END= /DNA_ORIENTATION=
MAEESLSGHTILRLMIFVVVLITSFFHLRSLALDDLPGEVPQ